MEEINREKMLFKAGTIFLYAALIEITLLPHAYYLIYPTDSFPLSAQKIVVGIFYLVAFLAYTLSGKYFKNQIFALIIGLLYYVVFVSIIKFT